MRLQLMEATITCLIEGGYARTTTVEICRQAGVTRGALLHHFRSLGDLFAATLSHIYERLLASSTIGQETGEGLISRLWEHFSQPEYKAVVELWLAARNEPELGASLQPAILRIRDIADPRLNPRLSKALGASDDAVSFYRLVLEAMIGMALGRAVTPGGGEMGHEKRVVDLLQRLSIEMLAK